MDLARSPALSGTARRKVDWGRWSGIAGIVVTTVASTVLVDSEVNLYGPKGSAADFTAHYTASGTPSRETASGVLFMLGILLLLWFFHRLRGALRQADQHSGLPDLAFGGGLLFVGLSLAAAATGTAVGLTLAVSDAYRFDPNDAILMDGLSQLLNMAAGYGTAVVMVAASLVALRTAILPRWLAWAGVAVGVATFASGPLSGPLGLLLVALFVVWVLLLTLRLQPFRSSAHSPQGSR